MLINSSISAKNKAAENFIDDTEKQQVTPGGHVTLRRSRQEVTLGGNSRRFSL